MKRKTSGRYRLVFLDSNNTCQISINCELLTGKFLPNQSMAVRSGLDLPILDQYILQHFKDEQQLRMALSYLGYCIPKNYEPKIAYKSEGTEKYLELVYQNQELYQLAVLCSQYKEKYGAYAEAHNMSSRDLRKLISGKICEEPLWKNFYKRLINSLGIPDFYLFMQQDGVLKDRELGYMKDYLDNQDCATQEQRKAFDSACYYLRDTFTAYKPIRGMIVCQDNYQSYLEENYYSVHQLERSKEISTQGDFLQLDPFSLLTEAQQMYLESHESYAKMPESKKVDTILTGLGITQIPWYKRTIRILSEAEAAYLEKHKAFDQMSYLEKINFANRIIAHEEQAEPAGFQKRIRL